MKTRTKEYTDVDVYQATLARVEYAYQRFDKIVVSFSGGKDSTAVLNCCVEVARKLNRLPVRVIFFDEEVIHPPTIEYVERVRQRPELQFEWYCLPVKHRNACSNDEPYWYCWDPAKKDLWVRPMPDNVITDHPRFRKGMSFQEFCNQMFPPELGTVGVLAGIRTQESLRRFRNAAKKKHDNYIAAKASNKNTYSVHPIYDWSSEDVWIAVRQFGWDYNRTYDVFNRTRWFNRYLAQRVCPPFGEEPLRGLWCYAECWPAMWHKMLSRVAGVGTAWRYSNTELYGIGRLGKPMNMTWEQFLPCILDSWPSATRRLVQAGLDVMLESHFSRTDDPIPDQRYTPAGYTVEVDAHPLTGMSWYHFCKVAIKGDLKNRTKNMTQAWAGAAQDRLGIKGYDEALKIFGKKR